MRASLTMEDKTFYHENVLRAIELVILGKVSDAENILVSRNDCFSRCGFAILKCVQALLSEDPTDVETALSRLEDASSFVESMRSTVVYAQCLGAELTLFTSLLLFRSGSLLKGAFYLRRAWKAYERCLHLFPLELDANTATNPNLCSSLNFGAGFFLFGCSMLPSSVGYVLTAIGFVIDRPRGLQCLHVAAEQREGYMAPLASIMLLWVARFFHNNVSEASRCLRQGLARYPGAPVWLFLGSYVARNEGDTDASLGYLREAHQNASETRQLALYCVYETGATHMLRLEWDKASKALGDFLAQTSAPSFRAYAAYQLGIALTMLGQRDRAREWFSKVKGWTRSSFSYDVWAARKSKQWLEQGMSDTDMDLVQASLLIEAKQYRRALNEHLSRMRCITDAHLCVHHFYTAQCWRNLDEEEKAVQYFERALGKSTGHAETWVAPHAYVELAEVHLWLLDERDVGLAYLQKANSVPSGYDLEKPLSRQIAAITLQCSTQRNQLVVTAAADVSSPAPAPPLPAADDATAEWQQVVQEWQRTKEMEDLVRDDTRCISTPATPTPPIDSFELNAEPPPSAGEKEVFQLIAALQDVPLRTLWKGLTRHTRVFSGDDAMAHLVRKGLTMDRAAGALKRLLDLEVIHEVDFSSSIFLGESVYRFAAPSNSSVLNASPPYRGPTRALSQVSQELMLEWQCILDNRACFQSPSKVDLAQLILAPSWMRLMDRLRSLTNVQMDLQGDNERRAFWLNIYNMLALHSLAVYGSPSTASARKTFFRTCSYQIGGLLWSLDDVEHGALRRNQKPPYTLSKPFGASDARLKFVCEFDDARVHFALNCGALSCPSIQLYTAENLSQQLDDAASSYLRKHVKVVGDTLWLPRVIYWYEKDFPKDIVAFVSRYVPEVSSHASPSVLRISWLEYDWSSIGVGLANTQRVVLE